VSEYVEILRAAAKQPFATTSAGGVAVVRAIRCDDKTGTLLKDGDADELNITATVDGASNAGKGVDTALLLTGVVSEATGLSSDRLPIDLLGLLKGAFHQTMDDEGESRPLPPVPLPFKQSIHFEVSESDDFLSVPIDTSVIGNGIDVTMSSPRTVAQSTGSDGPGQYTLLIDVCPLGADLPSDVQAMIDVLLGGRALLPRDPKPHGPTTGPTDTGKVLELLNTAFALLGIGTSGESGRTSSALSSAPRVNWRRLGRPMEAERITAASDGTLYAVNRDLSLWMNRRDGRDDAWIRVGALPHKPLSVAAGGSKLFYLDTDRVLWAIPRAHPGNAPVRVGNPYAACEIAGTDVHRDAGDLVVLNDDRTLWASGAGGDDSMWKQLGRPFAARKIAVSRHAIYALNDDKTLWRSTTGADSTWAMIDHPMDASEIAAITRPGAGEVLYSLNTDNSLWTAVI